MSKHEVPVVPIVLEPHPNADSLSIVRIYGWTVIVRTDDWKDKALGAYIPPDYEVPSDRPEFAFLKGHERIRVRRFRGLLSQGLLMPAPEGSAAGDNVIEALGVKRYVPPEPMSTGGDSEPAPEGYRPVYDAESWHRYGHVLSPGEDVYVSEKIHGTNSRFSWQDGRIWCGSRTNWKKADAASVWWRLLHKMPQIEAWCREHEGWTLYGEVYGSKVSDLHYGAEPGELRFAAFDVYAAGDWLSIDAFEESCRKADVPMAPVLYRGPYDPATVAEFAKGPSTAFVDPHPQAKPHIREGCVVRPTTERRDMEIGRVLLKIVSDDYLERAK